MILDLCKVFNVEEGEEFKLIAFDDNSNDAIYRIYNNKLEYKFSNEKWLESYRVSINNIDKYKVVKLPKKKEFTDDELCILRNIDKEYKWIAKDRDGDLWIYTNKPKKEYDRYWKDCSSSKSLSFEPLDIFKNSLFTEIEWEDEEPICIDDYVDRENEEG